MYRRLLRKYPMTFESCLRFDGLSSLSRRWKTPMTQLTLPSSSICTAMALNRTVPSPVRSVMRKSTGATSGRQVTKPSGVSVNWTTMFSMISAGATWPG